MNKLLKKISWKRDSGRWDTTEIIVDLSIISIVGVIIWIVFITNTTP